MLGAATDACWSAAEQALIAAVDALHDRATLSDAEFTALSAHYDEAKIFEIILLCGFYRTVSYLANGLALAAGGEGGAVSEELAGHSGAMRSIELWCAIAHLRISRFPDVQLHI